MNDLDPKLLFQRSKHFLARKRPINYFKVFTRSANPPIHTLHGQNPPALVGPFPV